MSYKTTIFLFILLAGLCAFYFLYERERPSTEEVERSAKLFLGGLKPAEVLSIAISRPRDPTATAIVVTRGGSRDPWTMSRPVTCSADQGEVDGLLSTLEYLEKKETLSRFDERAIGLAPPRLEVEIGMAGKTVAILFGEEDVTGKNVYARLGGKSDVQVVPGYAYGRLDRGVSDLRDKTLFTLDRWRVERLGFARAGAKAPFEFKKDGERWVMDKPANDYADKMKVEDLLGAAHGVKAKSFVAEEADRAALARYGLEPAEVTITLHAGSDSQALEIGWPVPGAKDEVYARRADRSAVVTIGSTLLEDAVFDPEHWRSKSIIPATRDQVLVLEVRREGAATAIARLTRKDGPWRFVEPVSATAEAAGVDDLVRAIEDLQAVATPAPKIEDPKNFGLGPGQALVVTLETAKEKHAFRLGKATTRTDGYFVVREGREAALEVVFPKAPLLRTAYPALRERKLLSLAPAEIVRIDVKMTKGERPYARTEDGWSTPGAKADAASLDRLAEDLAGLTAERIVVPPEDLGTIGLKEPWLRAAVSFRGESEPPAVIEIGKVAPEGNAFHARFERGGETTVFALRKDIVDALDAEHVVAEHEAGTSTSTSTSAGAGTEPAK